MIKKGTNLVYVVIGQFTESVIPSIHVSVFENRNAAIWDAKRVGGIVLRRRIHKNVEEVEDADVFKLWTDVPNDSDK
jgi:hypothetical protein